MGNKNKKKSKQRKNVAVKQHEYSGRDNDGNVYRNQKEMWRKFLGDETVTGLGWYRLAEEYWAKTPATVDGVLGGFEVVHEVDIVGSLSFLAKHLPDNFQCRRVLDVGAGIGRISFHLFRRFFDVSDLCEVNRAFLDVAEVFRHK